MSKRGSQHGRSRLASVGNAAALFGGGDGADFFNAIGANDNDAPPPPPPEDQSRNLGISTVMEEEEPISPDMVSGARAGLSPQVLASDTGVFASSADWDLGRTEGAEEGGQTEYQQKYDYHQQASSGGDAAGGTTYDYSQQTHQPADTYSSYPTEPTEPPYYPGYIYDQASNSYLPDPSAQPEGWSADQQSTGYQATVGEGDEQAQWTGYEGQGGYEGQSQYGGQTNGENYEPHQQQQSWEPQAGVNSFGHDAPYPSQSQSSNDPIYEQPYEQPYRPPYEQPYEQTYEPTYEQSYGYQQVAPPVDSQHDPYTQQQAAPDSSYAYNSTAPSPSTFLPPPPKAVAPPTNFLPPPPKAVAPPPPTRTNSNPPPRKFQHPPPPVASVPLPSVASAPLPSSTHGEEAPYGVSPGSQLYEQPAPSWEEPVVSPNHDEAAARRAMSGDTTSSAATYEADSAVDSLAQDFSTTYLGPSNHAQQHLGEEDETWAPIVPEVNISAPSPELQSSDLHGIPYGQTSQEYATDDVEASEVGEVPPEQGFGNDGANYGSYEHSSQPVEAHEYGFDESEVFNDDCQGYGEEGAGHVISASNSGSNYGEWNGESEGQDGYNYLSNQADVSSQAPPSLATTSAYSESPYAPPPQPSYTPISTDQSYYPPAATFPPAANQDADPYGSAAKAHQARFASPPPARYASPPQSSINPSSHVDSFASYPVAASSSLGTSSNDPYGASVDGNRTAPATYGSFSNQQSPYSSQNNSPPNALRRSSFEQHSNQPTLAPYAATSYDPYARVPLERQASSSNSSVLGGEVVDLGLERRNAPVVSFGFGGRVLLVFPGTATSAYGSEASPYGSSSNSDPHTVHIRKLETLLAPSGSTTFPGPIFMDGGRANAGKKRKEGVAWLETRIEELERETLYAKATGSAGLGAPSTESASEGGSPLQKIETRIILVKLVKTLVENEGRLSGTAKLDETVRSILVPHSTPDEEPSHSDLPLASDLAFRSQHDPTPNGIPDVPIASYNVSAGNLDKISNFLLRGERRKAVQYALDHNLWAHAFIISSCVDTDCWKDVVNEFLRSELSPSLDGVAPVSNGREGLRVAYSMFAGFGGDSIQQFLPARPLVLHPSPVSQHQLLPPAPTSRVGTPVSPFFPEPVLPAVKLSTSVLSNWRETVAMIVANRTSGDSAALTALGDTLLSNGWLDAAHVCYLLSPATSPIGGAGVPSTRIVLLGAEAPTQISTAGRDMESIMLTELVEFAFSLAPTVKGQEVFVGFPHLQAFRLLHAVYLADAGQVSQSQKYTDAIVNTLKLATRSSPFYNATLVAQVKALSDRLAAVPNHDKGGSWITRNVPRPTIDSLWTTLEGRFTKFVAGEGDSANSAVATPVEAAKNAPAGSIGPFSHYSSIAPSPGISRTHSQSDIAPASTSSPSPYPLPSPLHSSAGPPPVQRAPFKTHHSRSSSLGYGGYNYDANSAPSWQQSSYQDETPSSSHNPDDYGYASSQPTREEDTSATGGNESGWWGSESRADGGVPSSTSGRAPAFLSVQESFMEDESGFISPMGAYTPSASPAIHSTSQQREQSHKRTSTRDELDDLGIGNNKSRKSAFASIDEQAGEGEDGGVATPALSGTATPSKADDTSNVKPSRSWLGGWFKREATPQSGPGPIKANLGEQTSFVYDAELKRWVNKKAGDSGAAASEARPPPPSRAATASPTRAARGQPPPRYRSETPPMPRRDTDGPLFQSSGALPPHLNRARTSADLNAEMLRSGAGQFRSSSTGAPPPPMPSRPNSAAGNGPPPAGGATGGVRRKPINKRYVAIS